ncbi:MAG: SUMF1/EgtB/PvdO family nonheme iron enzyme [Verrucomicrobiota bacterium]
MGSDAPYALPNERPAHHVKVKPFFMDIHAVTNAEFEKIREGHRLCHRWRAARRLGGIKKTSAARNAEATRRDRCARVVGFSSNHGACGFT